jgi:hypothetical protein
MRHSDSLRGRSWGFVGAWAHLGGLVFKLDGPISEGGGPALRKAETMLFETIGCTMEIGKLRSSVPRHGRMIISWHQYFHNMHYFLTAVT